MPEEEYTEIKWVPIEFSEKDIEVQKFLRLAQILTRGIFAPFECRTPSRPWSHGKVTVRVHLPEQKRIACVKIRGLISR